MEILGIPEHMYLRKPSLGIVFSIQEYRGKLFFDTRYYRLRNLTKTTKKWCPTPKGFRVEVGEIEALMDVLGAFLGTQGLGLEVTHD